VAVAVGGVVATVNVTVDCPAATVTEAGTTTAGLLLVRVTAWPPAGAAALSVTVPVTEPPPPIIEVGLSDSEFGPSALTVNVAVLLPPL
jgi:hypothetical protein